MKKIWILVICCITSVVFSTTGVWGADVCVSSETDFQDALDNAEVSGESDIIRVVQGNYNGNFSYSSGETFSLTLLGGYTSGCLSRTVNAANTILDGGDIDTTLYIYNTGGSNVVIEGFTIRNGNSSASGGGVYVYSSGTIGGDISLQKNIFTENSAGASGGGVYAGSYSNTGLSGNISFMENSITGNTATSWYGGGICAVSDSTSSNSGTITITSNSITGNSSGNDGGGAYAESNASGTSGAVILTNNSVTGNNSSFRGAGIMAYSYSFSGTSSPFTLTNNIITGNTAIGTGGGLFAQTETDSGTAGGITLTNNTFTHNTAGGLGGGGVFLYRDSNSVNVSNNIIWGNTAAIGGDICLSGTGGTRNGYNNDYSAMAGDWDNGIGTNIDADPLLNSNCHLKSSSPCLDAGTNSPPGGLPATDIDGDNRKIDGNRDSTADVDIGADEYVPKGFIAHVLLMLLN